MSVLDKVSDAELQTAFQKRFRIADGDLVKNSQDVVNHLATYLGGQKNREVFGVAVATIVIDGDVAKVEFLFHDNGGGCNLDSLSQAVTGSTSDEHLEVNSGRGIYISIWKLFGDLSKGHLYFTSQGRSWRILNFLNQCDVIDELADDLSIQRGFMTRGGFNAEIGGNPLKKNESILGKNNIFVKIVLGIIKKISGQGLCSKESTSSVAGGGSLPAPSKKSHALRPIGQLLAAITHSQVRDQFITIAICVYRVALEHLKRTGRIRGQPIIRHILAFFYPIAYRGKDSQIVWNIEVDAIEKILAQFGYSADMQQWISAQVYLHESLPTERTALQAQVQSFTNNKDRLFQKFFTQLLPIKATVKKVQRRGIVMPPATQPGVCDYKQAKCVLNAGVLPFEIDGRRILFPTLRRGKQKRELSGIQGKIQKAFRALPQLCRSARLRGGAGAL